jgi:RNA polymerase sigma-70 factor (ECF subfamily)
LDAHLSVSYKPSIIRLVKTMVENGERDRVDRAQQLEQEALEEIFLLYHDRIYRYAYFKLGAVEEAEDVAGQVFLEMIGRIGKFRWREGATFASWLFSIAHNLCVSILRNRKRDEVRYARAWLHAGPEPDDRLCDTVMGILQTEDLMRAYARLTDIQRSVLALRFSEGLSLEETGRILGRRVTAVKALQRRALCSLRRHMEGKLSLRDSDRFEMEEEDEREEERECVT